MSEDLISRKAAIDAIWDGTNMDIYTREVKEILEGLPSAPPVCIAKVSFDKAEMKKIIEDLVEQMEISVTDFADNCRECGKIMNEKLNNAQQKTGRWIPVSERLPEKTGIYLISIGDLVTSKSFDGHNFRTESEIRFVPDAWQPLPEPYKPQERSDKE